MLRAIKEAGNSRIRSNLEIVFLALAGIMAISLVIVVLTTLSIRGGEDKSLELAQVMSWCKSSERSCISQLFLQPPDTSVVAYKAYPPCDALFKIPKGTQALVFSNTTVLESGHRQFSLLEGPGQIVGSCEIIFLPSQ